MDFLEKLDFLMDRFGLTKTTLSQKSGIPYTTIDAWYKKGYEGLKLTTLRKLAQYFNTSLDYWFLDEITDPNYGRSHGFEVEYDEMEHIKKYRFISEHSPEGAKTVDMVLSREFYIAKQLTEQSKRIAELENTTLQNDIPADNVRIINYYYRLASAGTGQIVFDTPPTKRIEIPNIPEYKRVDYAIGVNGNSMEPVYHDGDMLLVEMTEEVDPGDIGIFLVNNESYVKKLGDGNLISLNPEYDNIPLTENSKCMGKVVGILS